MDDWSDFLSMRPGKDVALTVVEDLMGLGHPLDEITATSVSSTWNIPLLITRKEDPFGWNYLPDADGLAAERPSTKTASFPDSSEKIVDNVLDQDNASLVKPSADVALLDLQYSFEHRKLRPVACALDLHYAFEHRKFRPARQLV